MREVVPVLVVEVPVEGLAQRVPPALAHDLGDVLPVRAAEQRLDLVDVDGLAPPQAPRHGPVRLRPPRPVGEGQDTQVEGEHEDCHDRSRLLAEDGVAAVDGHGHERDRERRPHQRLDDEL